MNSIRTRILTFFSVFGLAAALAVFMISRSSQDVGQASEKIVATHLPMVHTLGQMQVALNRQDNTVYRFISTRDKMWLDEFEKERQRYLQWYSEALQWASENLERDRLDDIDELYVQYDNHIRKTLLTANRTRKDIRGMLKVGTEFLDKIQAEVDQIISMRQGMTVVLKAQINKTLRRNQLFAFYFPIIILVFFVFLAMYLFQSLVQPLTILLNGIRNFTRGQTEVNIPSIGKDELGELQEAFNEMSKEITVERRKLRSESQSDALTGLFNMRYFRRQLIEEFSRSQRYAHPLTMLMLDVDYFKNYNDRNGHPAGDIVLKEVARLIIRNVRGTDIVARYGGEEFVILLPETPALSAAHVAEKIRKSVANHHFPFRETHIGHKLTVSLGVGSFPDKKVTSGQALIEVADKSLYAAKKNGRNCVYVYAKGWTISRDEFLTREKKTPVPEK